MSQTTRDQIHLILSVLGVVSTIAVSVIGARLVSMADKIERIPVIEQRLNTVELEVANRKSIIEKVSVIVERQEQMLNKLDDMKKQMAADREENNKKFTRIYDRLNGTVNTKPYISE